MAKISQKYEVVVLFSCKDDEATKALVEKFTAYIAEHGTVDSVEEWGKRRLAYPIQYETEGYYILVNFTSDPSFPAELDRIFNITDGVLRSLITAKEEK